MLGAKVVDGDRVKWIAKAVKDGSVEYDTSGEPADSPIEALMLLARDLFEDITTLQSRYWSQMDSK